MINEIMGTELDVDKMDADEMLDVIKILLKLMFFESNRVTQLQDRVLKLEMKNNE